MELLLTKPIMAHGEKLHVLELREPTYAEVQQFGLPFSYGAAGETKIDTGVALRYIPVLAGIPPSAAEKMALRDVTVASMSILGFFMGSGDSTSSEADSTTSAISGE